MAELLGVDGAALKRGDRIVTAGGRAGVVTGTRRERSWGMQRPIVRVWLIVELDEGGRLLVAPADAKLEGAS